MSSANWRPFCLGLNVLNRVESIWIGTRHRNCSVDGHVQNIRNSLQCSHMSVLISQIIVNSIVCPTACSDYEQTKLWIPALLNLPPEFPSQRVCNGDYVSMSWSHYVVNPTCCRKSLRSPWFIIKMLSCRYTKSHCGDKTILRRFYLHSGISYSEKIPSLYWTRTQIFPLSYHVQRRYTHPYKWDLHADSSWFRLASYILQAKPGAKKHPIVRHFIHTTSLVKFWQKLHGTVMSTKDRHEHKLFYDLC